MIKAAGAALLVFAAGAGAMRLLSGFMGTMGEAAALGLVGMGLLGTSQMLSARGGRRSAAEPGPQPAVRASRAV